MTKVKIIADNENCRAIDIGSFDRLSAHEFIHPKFGNTDKSRIFIGEHLETTGSEISFRELQGNTVISFLHKHHEHEEVYIFLKGSGRFQVDEDVFPVKEGSVVRVSPEGSRTLSNDSESPMVYMVVQSKSDSLAGYNVSDGYRVDGLNKLINSKKL